MNYLRELIENDIIWVSAITWVVAQVIKAIVHLVVEREFKFERLLGDGGMPSAHSAVVSAATLMCGLTAEGGFSSPVFGISALFALVVMRDAMGVRRETGKHALSIKELAEKLNGIYDGDKAVRTENLKVFVGHNPLQVVFGLVLGISISLIYYFVFIH